VVEGDVFESPFAGTFADVAAPDVDHHMIAFVLLHDSMTQLSNDDIRIPFQFGGEATVTEPTGSSRVVMEDGVTFPPVPVTTEDGTDWIYSD